ncbi:MAG: hypothetical protein ACKOJF_35180 [Planctomycetaceae bacterium]
MTDYDIRPIGRKCAATGADLVPGSVCHSVLVEREGKLIRLDYSESGWPGPPRDAVGIWRGVVPPTAEPRREPLDSAVLLRCFEQLLEEGDPGREGLRYVLALILVKKRRLRIEGSRTDVDGDYLQLAGVQGEGAWEVRDLQPTDEEVETWQRELNAYLASEWH